jgi:predicted membrane protein
MATRAPQRNPDRQSDLRGGSGDGLPATDWNVFHSMREFWFWVAIVTLIIFCLMGLSFAIIHVNKQITKAEAILQRAEQLEKKRSKLEPKKDE